METKIIKDTTKDISKDTPKDASSSPLPEFPRFEDIPVSTKTFIVMTNITINISKLFEFLPVTEYVIVP